MTWPAASVRVRAATSGYSSARQCSHWSWCTSVVGAVVEGQALCVSRQIGASGGGEGGGGAGGSEGGEASTTVSLVKPHDPEPFGTETHARQLAPVSPSLHW